MSDRVIGTCSICGGRVVVPTAWYGIHPPTPQCAGCGAIARETHVPVIPMKPRFTTPRAHSSAGRPV